jgi:adenylate cyclase class 2
MRQKKLNDQEIEVKFCVSDLAAIQTQLEQLGAQLTQPRTLEINLRYDTSDGELARSYRVLRLRQDTAARLTFKGPAHAQDGARIRQEIEMEVESFDQARALLAALGYQVNMVYEKYRTKYEFENVHLDLDEMPYGNFIELEGANVPALRVLSDRLGLDWEASSPTSYVMLFEALRMKMNLPFRDLSFSNFTNLRVLPADMGLRPADKA